MARADVYEGTIPEDLALFADDQFDGAFCDPPYGLEFMNREWDDGVPGPSAWKSVRRVLKPGAYLLAFGGTRKWHRLAVAIEDAGFEIVDTVMWLYGGGFPTGYTVSNGLDGEDAERFDGYRTKLKPGWEPIVVAMNPRASTYAENVDEYGVAGYNIDGCRVSNGHDRPIFEAKDRDARNTYGDGLTGPEQIDQRDDDRFPSNVVCGPDVRDSLAPDGHDENGEFYFYCPKASGSERRAGLEYREAETVDDGRDTPIDNPFQRGKTEKLNPHPTVKPLDLTEWLARLIKPPAREGDTRDLLVPFSGSGSEMIGGIGAGWERVIGVEQNGEYCEIARHRLEHWTEADVRSSVCELSKFVDPAGDRDATVAFVGEAPGAREVALGEPFVGPSGKKLNQALDRLDLEREDVWLTNVVRRRPPENQTPSDEKIAERRAVLRAELSAIDPEVIVALGNVPQKALCVSNSGRGRIVEPDGGREILPVYHPAYILRGGCSTDRWLAQFKPLAERLGLDEPAPGVDLLEPS